MLSLKCKEFVGNALTILLITEATPFSNIAFQEHKLLRSFHFFEIKCH